MLGGHETLPCGSKTPVFACKAGNGVHDRHRVLIDLVIRPVYILLPTSFSYGNLMQDIHRTHRCCPSGQYWNKMYIPAGCMLLHLGINVHVHFLIRK